MRILCIIHNVRNLEESPNLSKSIVVIFIICPVQSKLYLLTP